MDVSLFKFILLLNIDWYIDFSLYKTSFPNFHKLFCSLLFFKFIFFIYSFPLAVKVVILPRDIEKVFWFLLFSEFIVFIFIFSLFIIDLLFSWFLYWSFFKKIFFLFCGKVFLLLLLLILLLFNLAESELRFSSFFNICFKLFIFFFFNIGLLYKDLFDDCVFDSSLFVFVFIFTFESFDIVWFVDSFISS